MAIHDQIINRNIILRFRPDMVQEPIVYRLVKDFDLVPNISKANVNPDKEGYLVLNLAGYEEDYRKALVYLESCGLDLQPLSESVCRDQEICTQCGACTAICPSGALFIKRPEMTVEFDDESCIMCRMCIQACPVKAVHLDL